MPFDTVKLLYTWFSDALGSNGSAGLPDTEGTAHDNNNNRANPVHTSSKPPTASIMITPAASDASSSSTATSSERSYFPFMPQSHRSSISSASTDITPDSSEKTSSSPSTTPTAAATQHAPTGFLDPLAREYPLPAGEPDLDELLARPPGKWSLGHYLKTPPREAPPHSAEQDKQRRAQELAAAKKELLEEWGSLHGLGAPARR